MTGDEQRTLPLFHDGGGPDKRTFCGYEILSELGRGGMGVVYRALQTSLKRMVALKMLTGVYGSDDVARFVAEAETSAALHHANIVHIYEVGENDNVPFFAMEFVEGGSLAERLKKQPLSSREAAEMAMTLARAVHYAHVHGVVHRDLKPQNVLLDQAGVPKIADFGIAKRLDDDSQRTTTGAIMGTPGYMAPEQAGGHSKDVGPAADVYALGAMLYEFLAGRPPFVPHESDTPIYIRVISEPAISPAFHRPDIPRDLEAICMMCLQKDPGDRFASAAALAEDLQRFLNDEPIRAKPPPFLRRAAKWIRRHPWRVTACIAALAGAAYGLDAWWRYEMYERPRVEWASSVRLRHGGIAGGGPIDAEVAARRAVCVRMTRIGRRGPIVKAEVVNPRGRPASVRDILDFDLITTWLEGVTGFAREAARGRETVSLVASYKDGEAVELTGHDRNDRVTVNVQYQSTAKTAEGGATGLASFRNARNFDYAMPSGASRVQFERSPGGFDQKLVFFNSAGTPARNGEGVYGYALTCAENGDVEVLRNLDASGAPMANLSGVTQIRYRWTAGGQLAASQFEDGQGRLVEVAGVAKAEMEYDARGNIVRMRGLDADGRPANSRGADAELPTSWAVKQFTYDDAGQVVAIDYRAVGQDGAERLVSRLTLAYDDFGYPHDCRSFGSAGEPATRLEFRYDDRGNAVERKTFDRDDDLVGWRRDQIDGSGNAVVSDELDIDGNVEERTTSVYENDRLVSQSFFDAAGASRPVGTGYTRLDCRYHDHGYRIEERYSGFPRTSAVLRAAIDARGRYVDEVWLDAQDRPAAGPDGWSRHAFTYDGLTARVLTESWENLEGKPAPGPSGATTIKNAYSNRGMLAERVSEGFAESFGYAVLKETFGVRGVAEARRYFDANGNKAWCKDGYHAYRAVRIDQDGIATEVVSEDYDPKHFTFHRARQVDTWRDLELVRAVVTYEDEAGQPVAGPDGGSTLDRRFDESAREVVRIVTGLPESAGAHTWRIDTEWGASGPKRRVHQALDDKDAPVVNTGSYRATRLEVVYGDDGLVRQEIRSGHAVARVGYERSEVTFAPTGALASAVHRRADGSEVAVRAVIVEIDADAQPQAKDLRVGDVLIAANGVPVPSALAFSHGPPFAGGDLEVERDGKRLTIAGFAPGTIGIRMIDHAVK